MLRKPGSVKVILSDTSADGFVYFPGTTLLGKAENCQAVIDSVPAGFIPAVYYANTSDTTKNHVTQTNITVSSGVTTGIIDLFGWKYSKKLYLNTTASGADVAQNVYNFPVLIRLTSSNFNFSQAVGNGADLRFTKSDNSSPLSYEIEQWDAGAQQAEVWVRVDTVYGNDNAHFIVMLWGNAGAAAASNPAAVFDTATGFQGVWHLSEPGNTTAYDATGNHYDGTPSGMTAAAGVTGAVGQAQEFDGTSNGYIQMKGTAHSKLDFAQHGAYSISAWVRVNVFNQDDTSFNCIVQKGDLQYSLQFGYTDKWQFCEYQDNLGWESDTTTATAGTWQYLVGIRQGTRQLLYLDGRLVCDTAILVLNAAPDSSLHARNTNYDVGIGRAVTPLWRGFNGAVDEVRIMNSMPTPDWIMLCYMNQKPDDALVQW
jgi:biopolymer transport protein ExbB